MTPSPPMALPPGRALLGWWRELAALAPRRMWFAHLALHRLEVLVEAPVPRPLAPLVTALRARLAGHPPARLEELAAELAVDRSVLTALGELEARPEAAGPERQRRTFWFTAGQPPVFLPLTAAVTTALPAPAQWRFDLSALEACVAAPAEWKARHGFPADVRTVVREGSAGEWRHVALDQAEQALLCLAERGDGSLVGYGVRGDTWAMVQPMALTLASGEELLGPVTELGPEAVRAAWLAWGQGRSLPGGEVEACALELADHRLVVRPPGKLLERLKAAKSEALRGEAWVLLGGGRVRLAARVEVVG